MQHRQASRAVWIVFFVVVAVVIAFALR